MKTIYTPIAVSSGELPEQGSDFIGIDKHGIMHPYTNTTDKIFKIYSITHWLKKEEVPELTEEEIKHKADIIENIIWDEIEFNNGDVPNIWIDNQSVKNAALRIAATNYPKDKVEVKWEENTNTPK